MKKRSTNNRRPKAAAKAKADEIVASLRDAVEVERSGVAVESRFTVRTVALRDPPTTEQDAAF